MKHKVQLSQVHFNIFSIGLRDNNVSKKKKIAIVSISAFNSPPVLLLLLFYSYGPYSHILVMIFITQIRYSCDEMQRIQIDFTVLAALFCLCYRNILFRSPCFID